MQPTSWLFDELPHAGEEHLDPAYVGAYDRKAQTDPSDDVDRLRTFGLDHTSILVDFGTGTGTFALAAAAVCRRVVAIDVSAPMLEQLRERARARNLTNIETVQSGFLTYRHRGEPADFAYSRNALHHVPDFWKGIALQHVAAVLRSGGIFFLRDLVYAFDPEDATEVIETWLARAPLRSEEGYTAADLATHVRTEYSTYTWLLEPMLQRAGFEVRDAEYRSQVFAAYTCIKR
jgi:ubiquinone/menaquinone biosynthesis C-methylase UbiE